VDAQPGHRAETARLWDVAPRTVRHWRRQPHWPPCRGRPCESCGLAVRQLVILCVVQVLGWMVTLAALRRLFVDVLRCVLADLLSRIRRVHRLRYQDEGHRLTWYKPGRVWAIDFSEASCLIDGQCFYLFAVRDLASHRQLGWLAVAELTTAAARGPLEELFREHGAPLVLKSDNGSAFISDAFHELLETAGTEPLYSPPCRPQYNGALERANGTLKELTQFIACRSGHPLRWTTADLEQAREQANLLGRPWGHDGPTPDEAWFAREPITPAERDEFAARLAVERPIAAADVGFHPPLALTHELRATIDRLALQRTLEQTGNLTIEPGPRAAKRRHRRTLRAPSSSGHSPPLTSSASPPHFTALDVVQLSCQNLLAISLPIATIVDVLGVVIGASSAVAAPEPTHGEWAYTIHSSRPISPDIPDEKTANIMYA